MSELISMQDYQSEIQHIDKDHTASMFMATCELNKVYSQRDYYIFVAEQIFELELKDSKEKLNQTIEKQISQAKSKYELLVQQENDRYQIVLDDHDVKTLPEEDPELIKHKEILQNLQNDLKTKLDSINNSKDNILKDYKATEIKEKWWIYLGSQKIMDISFRYPSSWTYNDVLLYFNKYGYPLKRASQSEILESSLNVCKVRHILRNDIMTDESILISFIEMWERKKDIEAYQKEQKVWQIIMLVVSAILTIVSVATPFLQPLTGWQLGFAISGIVASVGSLGLSIYNFVAADINAQAMEETTKQTNDLMLRNMPKSGNFVDTSITDPYAMYANGRLYKQGGAGNERFDQMLPHEPYRYLDDEFKDSDMFDILNNKLDKFAGGDDYFPSLYRDAKWSNPKAMKALLNGAVPIILNQRSKIIEAIFKWLSKEGLGTYYLFEPNWREKWWNIKDNYINRYGNIEFQDSSEAYGFTHLAVVYNHHIEIKVYKEADPDTGLQALDYIITKWAVSQFSTNTSWDKTEDNKTQKKENNITENSRIIFIKEETKILKGSEIKLELYSASSKDIDTGQISYTNFYENVHAFNNLIENATKEPFAKQDSYYECTYRIYTYGKKEVIIYSAINELKNYEKDKPLEYENKLSLNEHRIYAPKEYIWRIRGEHSIYLRFKARECVCSYCSDLFLNEETKQHTIPHITNNDGLESYFRYFDKGNLFGKREYIETPDTNIKVFINIVTAVATTQTKEFTKVTIYSKSDKDKGETDYFGINPFLNAKRNITLF